MKSIIFISPPAAGKGTQSKLLSEYYHIPHISMGDLLRDEVATSSDLGKRIKEIIDAGKLVDANTTLELLEKRLTQPDCANGYILDGYPRNMDQAKSYEKLLENMNKEMGHVIFLDIDKELAIKRTMGRIVCPKCGSSYNLYIDDVKPKEENICNRCHHKLEKRSDDNAEVVLKRFDTYIESTRDLLDYYKNMNVLTTIKIKEGQTANCVFEKIKEIVND